MGQEFLAESLNVVRRRLRRVALLPAEHVQGFPVLPDQRFPSLDRLLITATGRPQHPGPSGLVEPLVSLGFRPSGGHGRNGGSSIR
jgi:hypothetical protein